MRMMIALIVLGLCGPVAAQSPSPFQSGTTKWDGRLAARGSALMRSAMVAQHNRARRDYGSPPIVWDDRLAADAERYALVLARKGMIAHDPQTGIKPQQGENLFMGTRGAYSFEMMAKLWIDERRWFRKGVFPEVVTSGHWTRVGHYTQIIWPSTQRFGCALSSNPRDDFLVCRYLPAGNYFGVPLR